MASLRSFLLDKSYFRVRLCKTLTNHLELKAKLNGVEGSFILDTGASSSCVDFEYTERFGLTTQESDILAAGAGATDMRTEISRTNDISILKWKRNDLDIVLFDLSHVNTALRNHDAQPVHGILGADILMLGKGIIDYQYNCLYLR